ncbi:MAG: hypothetical protein WC676_08480 [Candidatus Omnitrophota bacterium]
MSTINLGYKKNVAYALIIGICLSSSGCGFLDLLPNKERDRWYMEHPVDLGKLLAVHEGMAREEVLEKWGDPWKIKNEEHWIYYFPDIAKEKTHIQFKNDIVAKMWTSFEAW